MKKGLFRLLPIVGVFVLIAARAMGGAPIERANFYVAPNGRDGSPGSFMEPFKTITRAVRSVKPGDLVYVRGGTYGPDPNARRGAGVCIENKHGEKDKHIRLWAFPGETPVFDFSDAGPKKLGVGILITADYWHIKGLEITGMKQINGSFVMGFHARDCNNCIFENIHSHHNGGSGFYLRGNSSGNLILNCDFHHNCDQHTKGYAGGHADGCGMGFMSKGTTNTIRGCRLWWNSDDGLDLWKNEGVIHIENCWAFWNGYVPGTFDEIADGNGFKLGKTVEEPDETPQRFLTNCIAYANKTRGFDQNGARALMVLYNNTAYKNGHAGFSITQFGLKDVLRNNIALGNFARHQSTREVSLGDEEDQTHNTWNSIRATENDFVSTDHTGIDGPREPDGSLPNIDFLKLKRTSSLIDRGVDVGLPFTGRAPDLGAFEYGVPKPVHGAEKTIGRISDEQAAGLRRIAVERFDGDTRFTVTMPADGRNRVVGVKEISAEGMSVVYRGGKTTVEWDQVPQDVLVKIVYDLRERLSAAELKTLAAALDSLGRAADAKRVSGAVAKGTPGM